MTLTGPGEQCCLTEGGLCGIEPPLTHKAIEEQAIWRGRYKVFGHWIFSGDQCVLFFLHQGAIVRLPFGAVFSEKNVPWLVETAILQMEFYIEREEFDKIFQEAGGEPWGIDTEKGPILGCICGDFATEEIEFISAYDISSSVKKNNALSEFKHFIGVCGRLGLDQEEVRRFLEYQIMTDFVLTNTDRPGGHG